MRNFWVKRGEWVIGPVTDQQIRQMARQQWFRSTDQVGIGEEGPWAAARSVVPAKGFNAEVTARRESVLEPATSDAAPQANESLSSEARALPDARPELARGSATSAAASDSAPAWFRRGSVKGQSASEGLSRAASDNDSIDEAGSPSESVSPAARQRLDSGDSSVDVPPVSQESSDPLPDVTGSPKSLSPVDDLYGDAPQVTAEASEPSGRFQTAEFDAASVDSDSAGDSSRQDQPQPITGRRTASSDWNFDLAAGLAPAGEDSEVLSYQPDGNSAQRDGNSAESPDQPEPQEDSDSNRKPVTDWELVIGDLDLDEEPDSKEPASDHEVVPFELSVHNLKTGQALSAAESAASAELDFARLANLAAADPALSRTELPAAPADEPPPNPMSPEERALRRTIGSDSFQIQLSVLFLAIGLQSCALSAIINGMGFVALRRFFLLSTEVFFPWGTGSTEVLEGADLALAGTAMAIIFALPFLVLSYLIRVDGRVLFYLISLGVALFPSVAIGSGSLNTAAGIVFACLLLAVPAVVSAVLSGMLAAKSVELTLQRLLAGAAGVGVLVAISIGFAAPNFSIENLLRELPPELRLNGGLLYVAMLFYSVQLTLLYFVVARIAKACLDESTQRFVDQHMLFHWMLTMTAFTLIGAVHAGMATGWGTAPILLGGLTAIVSLGFNLWSLVGHLEPRFDRLRIDD